MVRAVNVSDKKTVLDDSASIYHPHGERTEKETWKELKGFSAKWTHFKSYYLRNFIFVLAGVALVVYIIYSVVKPQKERELFVAILDGVMLDEDVDVLQQEYEAYFNLDREKQEMLFDTTMYLSVQKDTVSAQKFSAYLFAKELDVVIVGESYFQGIASNCFFPLSEQLPEDLYAQYADRFCMASKQDENGNASEEKQPYGLYVTDLLAVNPDCEEPLVIAICGNSDHKENAEAFLRYLLQKAND